MKHTKILSLILTIALPAVAIAAPTLYYYYGQSKEDPVDPSSPEGIFQEKFVNVSPHVVEADNMVVNDTGGSTPATLDSFMVPTGTKKISFELNISTSFNRMRVTPTTQELLKSIEFIKFGEGIVTKTNSTTSKNGLSIENFSNTPIECIEFDRLNTDDDEYSLRVYSKGSLQCTYAFFNLPVSSMEKSFPDPDWDSFFVTPPEFFFTKKEFGTKAEWSDTLGIDEKIIHFV